MSRPDLVLVGIPGAGKSTVGALLAQARGCRLVETDDLVEVEVGPAAEAFAGGEADFRRVEERIALAVLSGAGVVALGSGAVTSPAVREALAGLPVAWLRTSVRVATRRLGMNHLGMDALVAIRDRMAAMLVERAPCYAAVATFVVDTDRLTAAGVAAAIGELQQGDGR